MHTAAESQVSGRPYPTEEQRGCLGGGGVASNSAVRAPDDTRDLRCVKRRSPLQSGSGGFSNPGTSAEEIRPKRRVSWLSFLPTPPLSLMSL